MVPLLLAALLAAPPVELPLAVPVEGEAFGARLSDVDAQWQIALEPEGQARRLPAAELVRWGSPAELRHGPVIILADGGLVAAEVLGADKEKLAADSNLFGSLHLPLESLAGIVYRLPAEVQARDVLLDRVAHAQGDTDRILLLNGDRIVGRIDGLDEQAIRVTTEVGPVRVELERVEALVFNPALWRRAPIEGLHAVAGFRDGSRLVARQLQVDRDKLALTGFDGSTWKAASESLVLLEPRGGRAVYLSDLPAAGYRQVPYLDLGWPYRRDRNVSDGQLRAGGRLYLKGLGVHSAARLTYPLDHPYRRFEAALAIDDLTAGRGSVRFRVFLDGQERYSSPVIRGGQPPVPISLDVTGVKRLDLIVDFADRADEMDRADWLGARLVPK